MSDAPHPSPWPQIARDMLQLLTMVFCFYTANVGSRTHTKVEDVETRQAEVVAKQQEAAARQQQVKATLDAKTEEDTRAQGVTLYSTWKYLEDVAAASGSPRDAGKAAEARKLYEDHVKRFNK